MGNMHSDVAAGSENGTIPMEGNLAIAGKLKIYILSDHQLSFWDFNGLICLDRYRNIIHYSTVYNSKGQETT